MLCGVNIQESLLSFSSRGPFEAEVNRKEGKKKSAAKKSPFGGRSSKGPGVRGFKTKEPAAKAKEPATKAKEPTAKAKEPAASFTKDGRQQQQHLTIEDLIPTGSQESLKR